MRVSWRRLTLGVSLLAGALVFLALTETETVHRRRSARSRVTAPVVTTTTTERLAPGPEYVAVGSLTQEENGSRFDIPPGIEPYPWHFFELSRWRRQVIEPGATKVQRAPRDGPETFELLSVVNASLAELRRRTGDTSFTRSDALGGRYRFLPGAGVQYELYFRTRDSGPTGFHTVRVTRPLALPRVQYGGSGGHEVVNIILPYFNRLDTLRQFLGRFAKLVEKREQVVLTIVRYTDGFPPMSADQARKDRDGVSALVSETNMRLSSVSAVPRVRLIEKSGVFSRGAALMEGARAWDTTDDVLLFLCDVDMLFGESFLQRCRTNTKPGHQAYFPIVFNTYNPHIVFDVIKKKMVPILTSYEKKMLIDREKGYWIDFGFGMSCQYRSDFTRLTGNFFNISGWGLEDVRLYQQFTKSSVEIVRMPDPDLVHVYHKKQCNKTEVGKRFNSCLKSKAMNEASQLGWGLWVYKHMGDTDDIEEFLKVFRAGPPQRDSGR
ncbi:chondroitin sulfate N-acetylgalactosaminyltransferase 1-like [Amphibalanus amphitrite]|uniref:chondroitin sulfate N-acetylgalactosaminyltransferase 1-like n=1 Tax=Amphibalanus amphitrite TaxID=1232801 RepID=UPI001C92344A|nr:chondroitin sulfate N-acetylgalactosaminyltransferase 1-like [Amphibalanus amphitrite]